MSDSYHVFVSYSRKDSDWVGESLFLPLSQCVARGGGRPRIFFDVDALESGDAWKSCLTSAIQGCGHFVPVYSTNYFASDFCQWELDLACARDIRAKSGLVLPVKLDECAVPFAYSLIQFASPATAGWFEKLCGRIGLTTDRGVAAPRRPDLAESLQQGLLEELRRVTETSRSDLEVRAEVLDAGAAPERRTRDIALSPRVTRSRRRLGDLIRLSLTASRDCYVYVFDIGTTGKITLLFPNQYSPDNRLRAGMPVVLPTATDPYELRLLGKTGREVLQFFALDQPLERAGVSERLPEGFEPVPKARLTRDIRILAHTTNRPEGGVRAGFSQLEFEIES